VVTGHFSEGSFVRNGVVQIPKFDANPILNPNPNPMPIRFGQMTLRTSELFPCPGYAVGKDRREMVWSFGTGMIKKDR